MYGYGQNQPFSPFFTTKVRKNGSISLTTENSTSGTRKVPAGSNLLPIHLPQQILLCIPLKGHINLFSLLFLPILLSAPYCRAQSIESFSNFENVTQTFYHEANGRPYLNFSYAKISKEYSKFKFLKFGLPNFVIHGLTIKFDLVSYDHAQVLRKLSDFEKKSALRFVLARDSNLKFDLPQNQFLHLNAKKLKTGNSGNFRIEGAELTTPSEVQSYQFLALSFEYGKPGFQINKTETPATPPTLTIFYGNPSKLQDSGKE
jgi:hypothetical protein